ncbi:hypothetical protein Poly51_42570 [Rubripirellula tenax]|uniref:Uncharacterized protein n=1 Tax=Rubripirellula tenax TaxID=2528015 RepID=A0A5C6ERD9_9BACT|nr:hypothetical protein Poly51_42570 [Rubripirellula tenax]
MAGAFHDDQFDVETAVLQCLGQGNAPLVLVQVVIVFTNPGSDRSIDFSDHALGIDRARHGDGGGVTTGLQSRVARKVALCPSIDFAHKELQREGVELDAKAVKRVAYQCGEGLLAMRKHWIELMREGKLPAGDELVGKRVSVQIDGGRMKIRGQMAVKTTMAERVNEDGLLIDDAPGRSRKKAKRTYPTDWREPKLVTNFIHDDAGKMVKQTKATIDLTLLGPDAIAEMIAMHLHRLGAAKAESVTFVAGGAPWIWDRIEAISRLAGLDELPTTEVLDCCHGVHHISQALAAQGLSKDERNPLYRQHRTLLRNGVKSLKNSRDFSVRRNQSPSLRLSSRT